MATFLVLFFSLILLIMSEDANLNHKQLAWLKSGKSYNTLFKSDQSTEIRQFDVLKSIKRNGERLAWTPSTRFIVGLFNKLQKGEKLSVASGHRWSSAALRNSDTVRSFYSQGTAQPSGKYTRFKFRVPQLPKHEQMRLAEVRFPLSRNRKVRTRKIKISLRIKGTVVKNVVSRITPQKDNIYQVFDISKIISSWVNNSSDSITLDVRVRNDAKRTQPIQNWVDGLLVLYSEDKGFIENIFKSLSSHELNTGTHPESNRERRSTKRRRTNKWKQRRKELCTSYEFVVNFDLIGWGQWIIYPKTFNSKVCYGRCPSPAGLELNPSNHAMLQILMRLKRKYSAPMPCCAPKKLKPMSMIYIEHDEIVVRHHDDMLVEQCGCS